MNRELVGLYWQIGEYISRKIESATWGERVVGQLAAHIARNHPDLRGFTRPNLFRMRQFYETYRDDSKVAPLVRQLPWTHNLLFTFVGERYRLQVGTRDFFADLLFFHRGPTCLVAFELKVEQFEPSDLGQQPTQ